MPAAALLAAAVAVLVRQEARARPWRAAIGFGVMLGLAAYVRAVALPLALLAFPYWVAAAPTRAGLKAAVGAHRARLRRRRGGAAAVGHPQPAALRRILHHRQPRRPHRAGRRQPRHRGRLLALAEPDVLAGHRLSPVRSEAARRRPRGLRAGEVLGARSSRRTRSGWSPPRPIGCSPTSARCCTGRSIARACSAIRRARSSIATAPASSSSSMASGTCWRRRRSPGWWSRRRRRQWRALALLPFPLALIALYATFFSEVRYHLAIAIFMFPYAAAALAWLAKLRPDRARLREAIAVALAVAALLLGWPALVRAGSRAARSPPLGGLRLPRRREDHAVQLARDRQRAARRDLAGARRLERRRPAPADRIAGEPVAAATRDRSAAGGRYRITARADRLPPAAAHLQLDAGDKPDRDGARGPPPSPPTTVRDSRRRRRSRAGDRCASSCAPRPRRPMRTAPARCGSRIFVLSPIHVSATATSHDVRDDLPRAGAPAGSSSRSRSRSALAARRPRRIAGCGKSTDDRPATWSFVSTAILAAELRDRELPLGDRAARVGRSVDARRGLSQPGRSALRDHARSVLGDAGTPALTDDERVERSQVINLMHAQGNLRMPPDMPLPETDIQLVASWIRDGAAND